MRETRPSLSSSFITFCEITVLGPSTKMSGFECSIRALRVAGGSESFSVRSTESPERAAHAAAGMAYSGCSPEATITSADGLPLAAEKKRSMAAARA